MTEKETKETFLQCVIKKSASSYKKALIVLGITIGGVAIAFGLMYIVENIIPSIVAALTGVPLWVYVLAGFLIIPLLYSVVWCWLKMRKENEIKDENVCEEMT